MGGNITGRKLLITFKKKLLALVLAIGSNLSLATVAVKERFGTIVWHARLRLKIGHPVICLSSPVRYVCEACMVRCVTYRRMIGFSHSTVLLQI